MAFRSFSSRGFALALIAACWLGASQPAAAAPRAGEVVEEPRTLVTPQGETVAYEVGTLFVRENRARPDSRLIGVGFFRFKGAPGAAGPPTFHLPGGPGSSYFDIFTEKSDWARAKLKELLLYRAVGDVVVVDQRGYSGRGEMLTYRHAASGRLLDRPASSAREAAADLVEARAAVAAQPGRDLSGYTVQALVDDVDDLRRALGYDRVSLVGQSFGSQWAFAVMRLRPQIVARAVLSGVEPLDGGYDMPSHVFAALQRIAWDADHDRGLAPYLPPGGVLAAVEAVRARLAARPVVVRGAAHGGRDVRLGVEDLQQAMLTEAADWPGLMLALYHRRYGDWGRSVARGRLRRDDTLPLIGPLIDTSLGVTPARMRMLLTDPAVRYLGDWNWASYVAAAKARAWPTADVGDPLREPAPSDIPVVFVAGDWDVSTPVENALGMAPYFPNGRVVLVHRGGHDARMRLVEERPAVIDALAGFLKTGDVRSLPVRVELAAPAFKVPAFAPPSDGAAR